jgi:hypothetical protein
MEYWNFKNMRRLSTSYSDEHLLGDDALSKLTLATFSQSSCPGWPTLSVSVTCRNVMLVQGVYAVHLN